MASDSASAHQSNHILPVKTYISIGIALYILTVITVAVSFIHFGPYNLVIAIGIATLKASLVALIFMHLKYDNKLYATIFLMALLMLSFFIVITLFDTLRRGDINPEAARPFHPNAVIYNTSTGNSDSTSVKSQESGAESSATQQDSSEQSR